MKIKVVLEIDAPEPGTQISESSCIAAYEDWVWPDILSRGGLEDCPLLSVEICYPNCGICANCGADTPSDDYLCKSCRSKTKAGTARY